MLPTPGNIQQNQEHVNKILANFVSVDFENLLEYWINIYLGKWEKDKK